jgi:regulator of extracellular matrix RemA (YlzA/DUF370 family)
LVTLLDMGATNRLITHVSAASRPIRERFANIGPICHQLQQCDQNYGTRTRVLTLIAGMA